MTLHRYIHTHTYTHTHTERERQRERDRERQRDRETERERDQETESQSNRHRERQRDIDRYTCIHSCTYGHPWYLSAMLIDYWILTGSEAGIGAGSLLFLFYVQYTQGNCLLRCKNLIRFLILAVHKFICVSPYKKKDVLEMYLFSFQECGNL